MRTWTAPWPREGIGTWRNSQPVTRQQLQLLFLRYGWEGMLSRANEMCLWKSEIRPCEDWLYDLCCAVDSGDSQIDPKVETAFEKRVLMMAKGAAELAVIANARASATLARQAETGVLPDNLTKQLVATSNAAGWVYRNIMGEQTKQPVTRLLLPFPEPPKPKLPAGKKGQIVDSPGVRVLDIRST